MFHHHFLGTAWLIGAVIVVTPFWHICKRTGFSPWLSLLMALPLVNIVFVYILAFSDWPALPRSTTPPAGSPS